MKALLNSLKTMGGCIRKNEWVKKWMIIHEQSKTKRETHTVDEPGSCFTFQKSSYTKRIRTSLPTLYGILFLQTGSLRQNS
jgi:hypothetical protein